ncbi:mannitol dehydrogenase family protein [Cereibacter changlensis]|uniref:Mannitol dehydrogenase family protein n=1 Tax=Cereibacter changlensis TaxID=402884 RepID=A0A4U0YYP0_9RHOB|nr:mannitol dehydrogenase family protein [Cereibacter changlensis]TKA96059.1 mannitol dehydrogenase family protein [Cereibacter changlensis]
MPAEPGIVHLGLGAFFRAHGAVYVSRAMQASGGDWGIIGVSLQSPTMRDALAPQGFAYHAVEQGPEGETVRRIEVVRDILVAKEDPEAVLAAMARASVKIVSLTVTEKGYCHNPATGALNPDHPDIAHDLAEPLPRSAPGYLVRALQRRHAAGLAPFTVLCCDNLPENGSVVRGVVLDLARRIDPALADWIEAEGRFPSTMVDRIVPATKPEDIARLQAQGIEDNLPVMHEPFSQWVVEDDFVGGERPDLGAVGVQLVEDVTPFEHMKLRMLNGTHSSLAYLGYLAGHETIADTVADPVFAAFVQKLWRDEIIPVLTPPPGVELAAYADQLLGRYRNPAIRHRTWQIAMDGSQKLPQRILGTLAETLAAGRSAPGLMLAVAGWMRYVGGTDEAGRPIEVKDPLAADLARRAAEGVPALLALRAVFPEDLARALESGVTAAHDRLRAVGARKAVEDLL